MKITFDQTANALEIVLAEGVVARTLDVDPGTLIDLNADGEPIAIEVIQPGRNWLVGVQESGVLDDALVKLLKQMGSGYGYAGQAAAASVATVSSVREYA